MNRNHFGDIRVFVEVARRGGFRAAAEHLNQAPASISEAIKRFEDKLGVRLFERSTRTVALTPIGQEFFQRSFPAINDLEAAINEIDEKKEQIAGTLRLTAAYSAGPFFLDDLITRFISTYPMVDVELIYNDEKIDLLTSGVDAAIRSNTLLDLDTHAIPVGPELHMSIIATKDYLSKHGEPLTPRDIINHQTICYAYSSNKRTCPWVFKNSQGEYSINPNPRIIVNDIRSLSYYAQQGLGLAYLYSEIAAPLIQQGGMQEVLSAYLPKSQRYSLNYLNKQHMPKRLRAFIDMIKDDEEVKATKQPESVL